MLALDIDEVKLRAQAQALIQKPGLDDSDKSLAELGFDRIGVDDGWQACGDGKNGSFHDEAGYPLVNKTRFPDLKGLVSDLHAMGLKVDWYMNNCWCSEPELDTWLSSGGNPDKDVEFLVEMGLDGVKVDGCGPAHDIQKWSKLVRSALSEMLLENCANNGPFRWHTEYMPAELPGWVPATPDDVEAGGFNMYRVSRDIAPQFYSAMRNLQRMEPFLSKLSRPGLWAFPDNLEIANKAPTGPFEMSFTEWRTHFAAWCITSSPLVLGFDLTNQTRYSEAFPIVSNKRALEINQVWAGEPGRLVGQSSDTFHAKTACHAIDECEAGDPKFCQNITFPSWQLWAKRLPKTYDSGQAVLLINLSEFAQTLKFSLAEIGLSASRALAVDVWDGSEMEIDGTFWRLVQPHDSIFLMVLPHTAQPTYIM